MQTPKHDGNGSLETSEHVHAPETEGVEPAGEDRSDMVATVATVAVVGIAAAAFEAALLPGIVLGVAAVAAPKYLPKMGAALNPGFSGPRSAALTKSARRPKRCWPRPTSR